MNVAKGNSTSWSCSDGKEMYLSMCSTCAARVNLVFFLLTAYRAFSHDVTAAILLFQNMFQNKETAAMFGYVGVPRKPSVS